MAKKSSSSKAKKSQPSKKVVTEPVVDTAVVENPANKDELMKKIMTMSFLLSSNN